MKRFLIAHNNAEMRAVLHQTLYEAFEDGGVVPQIVETSNTAEALNHSATVDFDFAVISLSLAAGLTRPVADKQGLDLLRLLRERGLNVPVVLIAPTLLPEIEQSALAHHAIVICEDDMRHTLDATVIRYARYYLTQVPQPERNRLDIVINLAESTFRIKDQVGKMPAAATGRLVIRPERFTPLTQQLIERVRARGADWEELLRQLGADLRDELFIYTPNLEFRDEYTAPEPLPACRKTLCGYGLSSGNANNTCFRSRRSCPDSATCTGCSRRHCSAQSRDTQKQDPCLTTLWTDGTRSIAC